MDLHRGNPNAALASYLQTHHETLAALLPKDTTCNDLFTQVEGGHSIKEFFKASEDEAVRREFLRFTHEIQGWLKVEQAKGKAQAKRDQRDALLAASKERLKKRRKMDGPPPAPPTMAFEDAQTVAAHSAIKKAEAAREKLLKTGYTAKYRVPGTKSKVQAAV